MNGLFAGKRVLVFGVANERSIAWGIAKGMKREGAEFIFTYAGPALEKRVRPLSDEIGSLALLPCNVQDDGEVDALFEEVQRRWPDGFDVLIHSIAYANKEDLDGRFVDTSRAGFATAMDVSAYSLVMLAKKSEPFLAQRQGSIITLTYYGAEKVIQNYNMMGVAKAALEACVRYLANDLGPQGIRVNGISAGPLKTLAAAGIKGVKTVFNAVEHRAPLRRNITQEDIAGVAMFLCSELGSGVTGEITHVDSGFNILGI